MATAILHLCKPKFIVDETKNNPPAEFWTSLTDIVLPIITGLAIAGLAILHIACPVALIVTLAIVGTLVFIHGVKTAQAVAYPLFHAEMLDKHIERSGRHRF
ncbi:MAG: hypothetical protein P0S95_07080 [Rhabdochlamydiaceae bacterium]|nr:hypothetical protein [Candidatus Amphrikana amoebophyrae]